MAVYPRLALRGMMTEIDALCPGYAFALDIEYATWANPAHETLIPPLGMVPAGAEGAP